MGTHASSAGKKYRRLVIRDATVVSGRGTPAEGPKDIVIEGNKIVDIVKTDPISLARREPGFERPTGDCVIDAKGMYVIPGLIDMHAHVPLDDKRVGPGSFRYMYKLLLGHGITAARTCGFAGEETLFKHREHAASQGTEAIPRLVVLQGLPRDRHFTPAQARDKVKEFHDGGADGIKMIEQDFETFDAIVDEARKLGMKGGTAIHLSLCSELDAVRASNAGVTTIEHTYGIPEAAIPGVQNFPPNYNEMDELARFRQSAYNWIEADNYPERVMEVLDLMIRNGTVWNPTYAVYEVNRDLERGRRSIYSEKYASPQLYSTWIPQPGVHASFHFDWKTSDEIAWKKKYQIWMKYVKAFFDRGGTLTAGSDAGSQWSLYGVTLIRELELMQETGLHPLDVIKVATTNAARVLGLTELEGGVNKGYIADLAIIDGNPLDNFKLMYGGGLEQFLEDRVTKVRKGGVKWTIRDGVVFDAEALLREVEEYVQEQKAVWKK
ncbi:MAG: amidohydrolase family protein [Bacillota bacterium]